MPKDSVTVTLSEGEQRYVTLNWETVDSDAGVYEATVATDYDADSEYITVSAAPAGVVDASAPREGAFLLPTAPGSTSAVPLTPDSLSVDATSISLTAPVPAALVESGALDYYRSGVDASMTETAFGAFRAVSQTDRTPITVTPPTKLTPPLQSRRVIPTDISLEQTHVRRYAVDITLSLVNPRAREPVSGSGTVQTIDTATLTLAGGDSTELTLSGPAPATEADWAASVTAANGGSDTTTVTTSGGDYVLSFAAGTLALDSTQVGQIARPIGRAGEAVTVPLSLTDSQATTLVAIGSRVDAVRQRPVPDGQAYWRDTTPQRELTATVATPPIVDWPRGLILTDWSLSHRDTARYPWTADVTLAPTTAPGDGGDLYVPVGQTHTIPADDAEQYREVTIDGTLKLQGTLLTGKMIVRSGTLDQAPGSTLITD